uniref:Uncharacterized protein n=1 Tax=Aegilops tauschii subsp. strangulata TaxID=200361 RepID=A0A453QL31_AEGTS
STGWCYQPGLRWTSRQRPRGGPLVPVPEPGLKALFLLVSIIHMVVDTRVVVQQKRLISQMEGWCYHWKSWRNYTAYPTSVRGKDPSNKGHVQPRSQTRLVDLSGTPDQISRDEQLISDVLAEADAGSFGTISNRKYNAPQPSAEQSQMQLANNKVPCLTIFW